MCPRTYRSSVRSNLFIVVVYCLGSAISLAFLVFFATGPGDATPAVRVFSAAFFALLLLGSIYGFVVMLTAQVVLETSGIESRNYFSSKNMLRESIAGVRVVPTRYVSTLVLVPRDKSQQKLKISLYFPLDELFYDWLQGIPDLDEQDREQSLAQFEEELGPGETAPTRAKLLAQGKTTATTLAIAAGILGGWSGFVPSPPWQVIFALGALPLISLALIIRSKGLYQMDEYRNDARPSLAVPIMVPGLILLLRSLWSFDLLSVKPLVIGSVMVALALFGLAIQYDRSLRQRGWVSILPVIFLFTYAYGALSQANAIADHIPPQAFPVTVLGQQISGGRSTTWYLRIDPWGPVPTPSEVSVSSSLYHSVKPGDTVCVYLHPGALKVPWYRLSHCR